MKTKRKTYPSPASPGARSSDRRALLAEIERLQNQTLNPREALLEEFLQCPEKATPSQILAHSLSRGRGTEHLEAPSSLLPWLG